MLQFFDTLTDDSGNSLLGATVVVTAFPGGGAIPIYQTNGTASPIANSTVVADITGQVSFFAPDGAYILTYSYKGTQYKVRSPVQLIDPMGFVAATDTGGSANNYAVAGSQYPAQLYVGMKLEMKAAHTNTGASTLTWQGGSAQPINQPGGAALVAGMIQANGLIRVEWDGSQYQLIASQSQPFYAQTQAEINAGVTPSNTSFVPGNPRRYGAVGNGVADDTSALTQAIASNDSLTFQEGDIYGVTTVTFPLNGPHKVDFNGAWIRGIATNPTNAIVVLAMDRSTFIDYRVDGNFSQEYLCGTQWYNAAASSQYNAFFGMSHRFLGGIQTSSGTTVRGMIYGALVGQSSTTFAQSENQIYGWRTYGCQNPFYSNHNNGVLQMSDPIYVCVAEGWPGGSISPSAPWSYANGRALEIVNGTVNTQGGEIQIATSGTTFAAELTAGCFFDDVIIETDVPIRINGDGVRFAGGRFLQDQLQPCFAIAAGVTGILSINDMYFTRPATTGSFDNNPLIDASLSGTLTFASGPGSGSTSGTLAANWGQATGAYNVTFSDNEVRSVTLTKGATTATWTGGLSNTVSTAATLPFETILSDTESFEYRWAVSGADVRLVKNSASSIARYKNHRMNMTGTDTNVWIINTRPTDSFYDVPQYDHLGYSLVGWALLQDFGGGTGLSVSTSTGPAGYQASQFKLTAASGGQQAISAFYTSGTGTGVTNPPTLSSLKANAFLCSPTDRLWFTSWATVVDHGGGESLNARFYDLTGAVISDVTLADNGSIPTGSWKYIDGPIVPPTNAAYMLLGAKVLSTGGAASTIQYTDLRVKRA